MSDTTLSGGRSPFLHPATGGLILGLDWLLFSGTAATGAMMLPLAMAIGFFGGTLGATLLQRRLGGDSWGRALLKGLLSGFVVGLPFPIGGTLVGGAVLASSGLDQLRDRAARALIEKTSGAGEGPKIESK